MQKIAIIITQLIILLVVRLVYFRRVRVQTPNVQSLSGPIVIASNHTKKFDPFIITCFLPLKTILKVFPFSFMTANVYYYKWWRPLAFLAGCYPAKSRSNDDSQYNYGVGRSVKLLNSGYSIVIFPEGKRTGKRIEARSGISRILQQSNTNLLLCSINWRSLRGEKRQHIQLSLKVAKDNLDRSDPNAIMAAIYDFPR